MHQVLALRRVYPSSAFAPKRGYGLDLVQCTHPGVIRYITEAVASVGTVWELVQTPIALVVLIQKEETVLERFVFEVRVPKSSSLRTSEREEFTAQCSRALRKLRLCPAVLGYPQEFDREFRLVLEAPCAASDLGPAAADIIQQLGWNVESEVSSVRQAKVVPNTRICVPIFESKGNPLCIFSHFEFATSPSSA